MHSPRRTLRPAALALLGAALLAGGLLAATRLDDPPAVGSTAPTDPRERFGAFGRIVGGDWFIDAAWDDGNPIKAREVAEWILDGQFMRTRVFVQKPDGTEYQRYESIYAPGGEPGSVTIHGFAYNGAVTEATARAIDRDTLLFPPAGGPSGGAGEVRQRIVFLDEDTMQWTVWSRDAEAAAGGDPEAAWTRMIQANWVRRR